MKRQKKKVLFDMDGCKTCVVKPVVKYLNHRFPTLDMTVEDVVVWNFSTVPEIAKAAWELLESPGFFRNLEPYPGSLEAYQTLIDLGHDVVICTTPLSGDNRQRCEQEKLEWIIEHLGHEAVPNLHFSFDKTEIEADVIIDDQPHLTAGKTNIRFKDWLIVDQPYNRVLPPTNHLPIGRIKNDWSNWEEEFAKVDLL